MTLRPEKAWRTAGRGAATFLSLLLLASILGYTLVGVAELGVNSLVTHAVVTKAPVTFVAYRYSTILWSLVGILLTLRYTWAILPFLLVTFGLSELAFNGTYWAICEIPFGAFPAALLEYYGLLTAAVTGAFLVLRLHSSIRLTYLTFVFPAYVGLWLLLGAPLMQPHCVLVEGSQPASWVNFQYELLWQAAVLTTTTATFHPKLPTANWKGRTHQTEFEDSKSARDAPVKILWMGLRISRRSGRLLARLPR